VSTITAESDKIVSPVAWDSDDWDSFERQFVGRTATIHAVKSAYGKCYEKRPPYKPQIAPARVYVPHKWGDDYAFGNIEKDDFAPAAAEFSEDGHGYQPLWPLNKRQTPKECNLEIVELASGRRYFAQESKIGDEFHFNFFYSEDAARSLSIDCP